MHVRQSIPSARKEDIDANTHGFDDGTFERVELTSGLVGLARVGRHYKLNVKMRVVFVSYECGSGMKWGLLKVNRDLSPPLYESPPSRFEQIIDVDVIEANVIMTLRSSLLW